MSDEKLREMASPYGVFNHEVFKKLKQVRAQTEQRVRREILEWAAAQIESEGPEGVAIDWPKWFREAAKANP